MTGSDPSGEDRSTAPCEAEQPRLAARSPFGSSSSSCRSRSWLWMALASWRTPRPRAPRARRDHWVSPAVSSSVAAAADSPARWYALAIGIPLLLWETRTLLRALISVHRLIWGDLRQVEPKPSQWGDAQAPRRSRRLHRPLDPCKQSACLVGRYRPGGDDRRYASSRRVVAGRLGSPLSRQHATARAHPRRPLLRHGAWVDPHNHGPNGSSARPRPSTARTARSGW